MLRLLTCLSILALLMSLLVSCGGRAATPVPVPDTPTSQPATLQVRGMVLEVQERSLTEVELLRLRDSQGREWTFTTAGFAGFTPSHLRQHQAFGEPVLVTYRQEQGRLVAENIAD
ncbi:MAG: hypothetical protein FJ316_12615 [SAR202 cluster bacterium]|nr:hypothetical protein [SAR202 cluster bacterium]